jgi:hypothetical protein
MAPEIRTHAGRSFGVGTVADMKPLTPEQHEDMMLCWRAMCAATEAGHSYADAVEAGNRATKHGLWVGRMLDAETAEFELREREP